MFEKQPGEKYNGWANWDTWNTYNWLSSNPYYQSLCVMGDSPADMRNAFREGVESGYILDDIDMDDVDWDEIVDAFEDED